MKTLKNVNPVNFGTRNAAKYLSLPVMVALTGLTFHTAEAASFQSQPADDCEAAYVEAYDEARDEADHSTMPMVFLSSAAAVSAGLIGGAPVAGGIVSSTAVGVSSAASRSGNQFAIVLSLIRDSKIGMGPTLDEVARDLNVSHAEVADYVLKVNSNKALCTSKLVNYRTLKGWMERELTAQ